MAYCLAMGSQADVLTFSMILMLNNIQVRVLDLSDSLVYVHVSSHDLTSINITEKVEAVTVSGKTN